MNKHVEQITRNTQKIHDFLEKGHMSDNNYVGSDMPFFMKNDNDTFTVGHHNLPEMPNGFRLLVIHNVKYILMIGQLCH